MEYILLLVVVTLIAIPILTRIRDELAGQDGLAANLIDGLDASFAGVNGQYRIYKVPR
ncbi:MAG: hypothetical protein JNM93_09360 [Bacteriovoracaceae bacterium]|nr:hypothetical protein [Bacteriovoracaceae bacterium]